MEKIMENAIQPQISDSQIQAIQSLSDEEIYDTDYGWQVGCVTTQETIEDWKNSSGNWNERSKPTEGDFAGFPFISWGLCQLFKGEQRREVSVLDLGDQRLVMEICIQIVLKQDF